jgi:hypothetical protein
VIPQNAAGQKWLNPATNRNSPILTAPLPVQVLIEYKDEVNNRGPQTARLLYFGFAVVTFTKGPLRRPHKFSVRMVTFSIHDFALVDNILP